MGFLFGGKKAGKPAQAVKRSPEERWREATKNSQKHLKAGELGLYRNDLFAMADIRKDEGHRDDELRLLLMVCYLDSWPFSDLRGYKMALEYDFAPVPGGIIAPGVIKRISQAAKALGYSSADVEAVFRREVRADMLPDPVMTVDGCAKLMRMHLDGKGAAADAALKKETARYLKQRRK